MKMIPLGSVIGRDGLMIDGDWVESKDQNPDGDVRLTQLADVGIGAFLDKSARYMDMAAAKRLNCTFLLKGDLLVARMPDPIGRACIFPGSDQPCVTVVDVCIVRPDPALADVRYLNRAINSQAFQDRLQQYVKGSTRQRISRKNLEVVEIPLPPVAEQKRIAAILDQADVLRQNRRASLEVLSSLPLAIFDETFGDPVLNTKGWSEISLGAITSKIGSGATPTGGEGSYKSSGISLIRSMNVHDGRFVPDGLAFIDKSQAKKLNNVIIQNNDVLLNITGASVARVCRVPDFVLPARVNQHVSIIRVKPPLDASFLEATLLHPSMKTRLLQMGQSGATRQAITKGQLEELRIPLPSSAAQLAFALKVERTIVLKETQRAHLLDLDTLFASLQHRAFRGELTSKQAERELEMVS